MSINKDLPKATLLNYQKLQSLKKKANKFIFRKKYLEASLAYRIYESEFNWHDTVFEENGKTGLKDITGEIRVPAIYDDILFFYSYLYCHSFPVGAAKNKKVALVKTDGSGEPLTDFIYDSIYPIPFSKYLKAKINNKFDLYNSKGEMVAEESFDEVEDPMNGIIVLTANNRYGFIDSDGFYVKPEYEEMGWEPEEFIRVLKNGIWGYIDIDGEFTDDEDLAFYEIVM